MAAGATPRYMSRRQATRLAAMGLATAWLVSTCTQIGFSTGGHELGGAFVGGVGVIVLTVGLVAQRFSVRRRCQVAVMGWPFACAGLLLVTAAMTSTLASGASPASLLADARLLALVVFGALTFSLFCVAPVATRRAFASAALLLIMGDVALFAAGAAHEGLRPYLFDLGNHQILGRLPRFKGLAGHPASAGQWALLAVGLLQTLPRSRLRSIATCAGTMIVISSLSAATLALPCLAIGGAVRSQRLRWVLYGLVGACTLFILHVQPTYVAFDGTKIFARSPPIALDEARQESEFMPENTALIGTLDVRWIWSVYHYTARRSFTCVSGHWLTGIGPDNFKTRCPLVTMNTYGSWSSERDPHNQYTGWLAEEGIVGIIAIIGAGWIAARRLRFRKEPGPSLVGALVGSLVIGLGGSALLTLPVVACLSAAVHRTSANRAL